MLHRAAVASRSLRLRVACLAEPSRCIASTVRALSSSERGEQARGAMNSFLKQTSPTSSAGVWGDLIGGTKAVGEQTGIGRPQQSTDSNRRIYNNTPRKGPRRGAPPSSAASTAGAAGSPGARVDAVPGAGRGRPGRGNDDDDELKEGSNEDIPPEMEPYLFDSPEFEEMTRKGVGLDYSDMDPADAFFADAFIESFKTKGSNVRYIFEGEHNNRIKIPKPRATRDLLQTLVPDIHTVDKVKDEESYELASGAWLALTKNVHFSDEDKKKMCNNLAKTAKSLLQTAEEAEISGEADEFLIFQSDFRRGWEGLDEEHQRILFAEMEAEGFVDEVLDDDVADAAGNTEETEAVVDEDDLK